MIDNVRVFAVDDFPAETIWSETHMLSEQDFSDWIAAEIESEERWAVALDGAFEWSFDFAEHASAARNTPAGDLSWEQVLELLDVKPARVRGRFWHDPRDGETFERDGGVVILTTPGGGFIVMDVTDGDACNYAWDTLVEAGVDFDERVSAIDENVAQENEIRRADADHDDESFHPIYAYDE